MSHGQTVKYAKAYPVVYTMGHPMVGSVRQNHLLEMARESPRIIPCPMDVTWHM